MTDFADALRHAVEADTRVVRPPAFGAIAARARRQRRRRQVASLVAAGALAGSVAGVTQLVPRGSDTVAGVAATPEPSVSPSREVARGIKAPPPAALSRTDEFGLITALRGSGEALEVTVDRVDMLSGAEAVAAATAAGTEVSNDYYLRNDNPLRRTYAVAPGVLIWGSIVVNPDHAIEPAAVTLADLRAGLASTDGTLFHLEVRDGVVVGIEEQYRP